MVARDSTHLDIFEVAKDARQMRWRKFVSAWPGQFLLARHDDDDGIDDAGSLSFDTVGISLESTPDELAYGWIVYALNWPQDPALGRRLSVGRAPGCDLVVRFSFVSKMHAYVEPEDGGGITVGDHRSVNGTWVGSRRVDPGEKLSLLPGGRVRFGLLALHLVDGKQLHEALTSDAFAAWKDHAEAAANFRS